MLLNLTPTKGFTMDEWMRFLMFYFGLDAKVEYDRVNLGGGVNFDAFSLDGGNTWYLYYQGNIVSEEDFILGLHIHNLLGCAAAGLH